MMELKPTYEQLVNILKTRCVHDASFKVSNISEVTRGTLKDKQVYLTIKRDKRLKRNPYFSIPATHINCYIIEEFEMYKDGSIMFTITLRPNEY